MSKNSLRSSTRFLAQAEDTIKRNRGLPPVHLWNPELSGDLDMRIAKDGSWYYQGSPINRSSLVKLFSTILRREEDNHYYLVTPVEKWRITVEQAPFIAHSVDRADSEHGSALCFITNVGDAVYAGSENPIRVKVNCQSAEPCPFILVRNGLEARINRNTFYHLADMAFEKEIEGKLTYGVESSGCFFPLS